MLTLTPTQLMVMQAHAEAAYPKECCGLLLGIQERSRDLRWVKQVSPLSNDWQPAQPDLPNLDDTEPTSLSKRNRYWVDPIALMSAQRMARDRGWIVLGVFHSHPDHPAIPSAYDRQLAWIEYSYPILSVCNGQLTDWHSWRFDEAGNTWEETIEILPETLPQSESR
jgi:proteasome lid subunit RPN8/RPN11